MEMSDREILKKKRLRALKYCLLLVGIIIMVTLIITIGVLAKKLNNTETVCDTPECAVMASEMLARMNLSADPCTDFYQYACGQYASPADRPPDVGFMQTFDLPRTVMNQQIAVILRSPGNEYRGRNSTAVTKVKKFYSVCMNDTGNYTRIKEILLRIIKNLQSWPLSTDPASGTWNPDTWDFQNVIEKATVQNFPALFRILLISHPFNSSKYVLNILPYCSALKQVSCYNGPSTERLYRNNFEQVLHRLYGFSNISNHRIWSQKLWLFEKSLAEIFPTADQIQRPSNIMKISELQNKVTFFNVTQLMNKAFEEAGARITPADEIQVGTASYFERLNSLINNLGNQSKEILANYIVWSALYKTSAYAGSIFETTHHSLARPLLESQLLDKKKWNGCVLETVTALGFAVGALHGEKHFKVEDRDKISKDMQLLVDEFVAKLPQISWLKNETRRKAEEKVRAMYWQIGYPKQFENPQKLDEYYQDFTAFDNRLKNQLEFQRFNFKSDAMEYGKVVDKNKWQQMPTNTNAYYMFFYNKILVLGGILHKPMYSRHFLSSVFHGAMGFILAHELMHGFDTTGRNYDYNGNVVDWWDPESKKAYIETVSCIRDQYNSLTLQGHPVNGNISIGENMADCGGIKLAYRAYTRSISGKSADMADGMLPGLKMTGPQQFFLAFANTFCININDNVAAALMAVDPHSLGPVRVNTPLKNTPQFAEAFNCPKSSPMNPETRCNI